MRSRASGGEHGGERGEQATSGTPGKRTLTQSIQRKPAGARPDPTAVREAAAEGTAGAGGALPFLDTLQAAFGPHDLGGVRAHQDDRASASASAMGAEAYATGNDVAFARAPSLHTAAHEAAHVVQQRQGVAPAGGVGTDGDAHEQHADRVADAVVAGQSAVPLLGTADAGGAAVQRLADTAAVQLRSATWIERRTWLAFFDHYLPRKFLNNYMDDTGAEITMTQQEMQDCNAIVDIRRSTTFMGQVAGLRTAGGTAAVDTTGWGGAMTNGTLGNFTINWHGNVTVQAGGAWAFNGTIDFYDFWDFDPKGANSGRPLPAEFKVRVANALLPGKPFHIRSVQVATSQLSTEARATWPSGVRHVPDRAGRAGADVGSGGDVGAAGGDILVGPVGGDVGGAGGADAGGNAAEDLNP